MELSGVAFREFITLALDRLHMQHHGPFEAFRLIEEFDQGWNVMTIDRSDGDEAELLEPGVLRQHGLARLSESVVEVGGESSSGKVLGKFFCGLSEACVGVAQPDTIEILCHRALWFGDRHPVVVQNNEELSLQGTGVVEPFHRKSIDDRGVTDEAHDVAAVRVLLAGMVTGEFVTSRHAHSGRDGGAGMPDREEVEWTFVRFGESRHASSLPQLAEHVVSASQKLVGVALMSDIEKQSVVPEIEDVVHRDREFHHAEVRRKMSTGLRDLVADCESDFRSKFLELFERELLQVGGA